MVDSHISNDEFLSSTHLEVIQDNSDQTEINEQLFNKVSYIAHHYFKIKFIYIESTIIGYYIWKEATGNSLKGFPDFQNLKDKLVDNQAYFYLMNFEIFKEYRNMGYGTLIINYLKEEHEHIGNEFLILATEQSRGFWKKMDLMSKMINS
jgi:GNAT superfamily N-acetyltransferase